MTTNKGNDMAQPKQDERQLGAEYDKPAVYYASSGNGKNGRGRTRHYVLFKGWRKNPHGNCGTICETDCLELAEEIAAALNATTRLAELEKQLAEKEAERDRLREALFDMVWQHASNNDRLFDAGLSANEHAFGVLGLENRMTYEEAEKQALSGGKEG